jgi:putative ABC transport system substrate-binding protein
MSRPPAHPVLTRRAFIGAMTGGILAAPLNVHAQQTARAERIGVLFTGTSAAERSIRSKDSLLLGLRELGWVEGRNLIIQQRWADGKADRLAQLAGELAQLKVRLIVTSGTTAIRAARDAAPAMPIVMAGGGDPVGSGLVASLARPGGNVTGVSLIGREILGKGLELLKQAVPSLSRVAVLMNAANPANDFFFTELGSVASSLGIHLSRVDIQAAGQFESAISQAKGGGLQVLSDPLFFEHRRRIVALAERHRVPTIVVGREYVEAGGLLSYSMPRGEVWRRSAIYVDKILKGAKPADLPVEQPAKFELVINLKTAKSLGLTIPQALLFRADKIIQ